MLVLRQSIYAKKDDDSDNRLRNGLTYAGLGIGGAGLGFGIGGSIGVDEHNQKVKDLKKRLDELEKHLDRNKIANLTPEDFDKMKKSLSELSNSAEGSRSGLWGSTLLESKENKNLRETLQENFDKLVDQDTSDKFKKVTESMNKRKNRLLAGTGIGLAAGLGGAYLINKNRKNRD